LSEAVVHRAPTSASGYAVAAVMLAFHIGCLGVFFTGVSTATLMVAGVLYVARGLGITAGFHRLLAHRSYQASRPLQFLLALLGSLAIQGGPLWWVAHHRSHHGHTDQPDDVHSPVTRGFWQSHLGWMMSQAAFQEKGANSRDLHRYPEIKWLQRFYLPLIIGQGVGLYLLGAALNAWFPQSGTSGAQMLVWGLFVSTVLTWHITFAVNSVCHTWGRRPHETGDASTNNLLIGVLAYGEGWHNNHHMYPFSARHGLKWWQVDVTWWFLKALEKLGLVSGLKLPKTPVRAAQSAATAVRGANAALQQPSDLVRNR
jgi:stearoyl-CoA desaturase (Delta-9 desaturase)